MDGDALYFRDLLLPANKTASSSASPTAVLKAAALFEVYCLNDCAAELLIAHRDRLKSLTDIDLLLDLLTVPMRRERMGHKSYLDAYFSAGAAVVAEAPVASIDVKGIARRNLPWWLRRVAKKLLGR
jgi:hypothetical protein